MCKNNDISAGYHKFIDYQICKPSLVSRGSRTRRLFLPSRTGDKLLQAGGRVPARLRADLRAGLARHHAHVQRRLRQLRVQLRREQTIPSRPNENVQI